MRNSIKRLVIADDDAFVRHPSDDRADVLIACGDLLDQVILKTATAANCERVFAVKGNHDSSAAFPAPIVEVHLWVESFGGWTFGGFQGAWTYKPRGNYLYDQAEVRELLADFPPVDIFVAHNSPRGIHDREDDVHLGFDALIDYIQPAQPRYFLHGHQHVEAVTTLRKTQVVGVFGTRSFVVPAPTSS